MLSGWSHQHEPRHVSSWVLPILLGPKKYIPSPWLLKRIGVLMQLCTHYRGHSCACSMVISKHTFLDFLSRFLYPKHASFWPYAVIQYPTLLFSYGPFKLESLFEPSCLTKKVYKIYPKLQRLLMGILVPSLLSGDSICPMSILYLPDWWTRQARTHPCSVCELSVGLMVPTYPMKSDRAEGGTRTMRVGLWCLLVGKSWVLLEASTSGILLCLTILHTL